MGIQGEACTFRTSSTYCTPMMGITLWKNKRLWPWKDLSLNLAIYLINHAGAIKHTHVPVPRPSGLSSHRNQQWRIYAPFEPLCTSGTMFNSPRVSKSFLFSWTAWATGHNMCYVKGGEYLIFLHTMLAITHWCLCSIIWTFCKHPLMSPSANAVQFSSIHERTDQNLIFSLEL